MKSSIRSTILWAGAWGNKLVISAFLSLFRMMFVLHNKSPHECYKDYLKKQTKPRFCCSIGPSCNTDHTTYPHSVFVTGRFMDRNNQNFYSLCHETIYDQWINVQCKYLSFIIGIRNRTCWNKHAFHDYLDKFWQFEQIFFFFNSNTLKTILKEYLCQRNNVKNLPWFCAVAKYPKASFS